MENWKIKNSNGEILFEGTEYEMEKAFRVITWRLRDLRTIYSDREILDLKEKYRVSAPEEVKLEQ